MSAHRLCLLIGALGLWLSGRPLMAATEESGAASFPAWTYQMKVRPFDVLYSELTSEEIGVALERVVGEGANTVIFSLEEEQMYGSFVDEGGFTEMLGRAADLIGQAHARGLKAICYINALEVMAHDACGNPSTPTLARAHPEWLQSDLGGRPMVWRCIRNDWITRDMEDAWASPYSGFRSLAENRIARLGQAGLDAIYIDQASLPGMQDFEEHWGSTDSGSAAAFLAAYGLAPPTRVDWESVTWRKFLIFRFETTRDYLAALAEVARQNGAVPFFESSSNDTDFGTLLGNAPALSVRSAIACSPEVEPEGNYLNAFRMAKFAREIAPSQPMLFLGWPRKRRAANREFALTLCQSGNYYPTADGPIAAHAFEFMDALRGPLLDLRQPYAEIGLVYSARNMAFSYDDGKSFRLYRQAARKLLKRHLPFRIVPLETISSQTLAGLGPLVLPGLRSLTDAEFALLDSHPVVPLGKNGTGDRWLLPRSPPLVFSDRRDLSSLAAALPFRLRAPKRSLVEYYTAASDPRRFLLFVFSPDPHGKLVLTRDGPLEVTEYRPGRPPRERRGSRVALRLRTELTVLDLRVP